VRRRLFENPGRAQNHLKRAYPLLVGGVCFGMALACSSDGNRPRHGGTDGGTDARSDGAAATGGHDADGAIPPATGGTNGTGGNGPRGLDSGAQSDGASNDGGFDGAPHTPVDLPDGATAAIVGSVNGDSLDAVDGFSFVQTGDVSTLLSVRVVNYANACTDTLSMLQRNTFHRGSRALVLNIANDSGDIGPGTYAINVTYPSETPPESIKVTAISVKNDDRCAEQLIFASGGTIHVDEVTDSRIAGTFDLVLGGPGVGQLRGTFAAPRCDAFTTVTTFADAGAGACIP
jgi:hypothetical protein